MDVKIRAKCAAFTNLKVPQSCLDLLLIRILFMSFFPTKSYPFF